MFGRISLSQQKSSSSFLRRQESILLCCLFSHLTTIKMDSCLRRNDETCGFQRVQTFESPVTQHRRKSGATRAVRHDAELFRTAVCLRRNDENGGFWRACGLTPPEWRHAREANHDANLEGRWSKGFDQHLCRARNAVSCYFSGGSLQSSGLFTLQSSLP